MDAQRALNSFLGRLTTVLVNEAQLLGGVRGDVEFIKDEMESMNGLLLHLAEANHHDHQVRAWMKQVIGLTRDCDGNVELYIQYVAGPGHQTTGLLGYLQQILRFVRTVPARRRVATRIRELKVRARDVGDRRVRYGVIVPSVANQDDAIFMENFLPPLVEGEEENVHRHALFATDVELPDDETLVNTSVDRIIEWLTEEAPAAAGRCEPQPRIIPILWNSHNPKEEETLAVCVAQEVYRHPSMVKLFDCKAWVRVRKSSDLRHILQEILANVLPLPILDGEEKTLSMDAEQSAETVVGVEATQLTKKLQDYLKGKKFFIVLEEVSDRLPWDGIRSALSHTSDDCSPGSAIVITTWSDDVANSSSPFKIFRPQSLFFRFYDKARELTGGSDNETMANVGRILGVCYPEVFAMKIFLHLLYVNPNRSRTQLGNFVKKLSDCVSSKTAAKQMVRFSYNDMPTKYRSCLLYLTISWENGYIRRTTVSRRWIAEGLIGTRENRSEDEADRCFDALVSWGLINPGEISGTGKIKSYTIHHMVREVIARIARDLNFADADLPFNLARHLPVHHGIGLQASHCSHPGEAGDSRIIALLPYLSKSSQWQLLRMLDLEGCIGLKKHHWKSICKILLLKYLSLRNTDVSQLPKKIENLQCLETLDIRQTAVRAFSTKSIMLPMLKHLFAGQTDSSRNNTDMFKESFATVRLPSGIRRMIKLEVLSHVEIDHNVDDLADVGQLLQLRKLGLVLHGNKGFLGLLLQQVEKLHACLRSLSVRFHQMDRSEPTPDAEEVVELASPPKLLQSLNISGITSTGFPLWIAKLDQLAKISLSETYLSEAALRILGRLRILRCLKLRHKSYTGSHLSFKGEEFQSLKSLVVEGSDITNITFDVGAGAKLEMIVWSFAKMDSVSGVVHLPRLKKLELNGDCNIDRTREAIKEHPNHPDFKHNGQHQRQEAVAVAAASTP